MIANAIVCILQLSNRYYCLEAKHACIIACVQSVIIREGRQFCFKNAA